MTTSVCLKGGQVLTPQGDLEIADVHIAEGRIVESPAADSLTIDCRGYCVLPGMVDVHGDAFELELHPRPGVDIAFPIAMGSVDRQLLANGITTAFHGLTLSWEPGARSLDAGRRFMDGLQALRPRLTADHRVQLRWETFAHDAIEDLGRWLGQQPTPAIAFNDHTTATMEKVQAGNHKKLGQWAQRAGLSVEQYLAEVDAVGRRAPEVPAKIREVAGLARRQNAIMLSHDERSCDERATHRDLGMQVCEFPLARVVAEDAVARGEHVILGGPNVIRGGSHTGAMSAEEAIGDGLCTVLASDYYYPSLLHAAEGLVDRGVLSLSAAWDLVSSNPAAAMGLQDRGRIEVGCRADVVVIDCSGPWRLVHTLAGGEVVLRL
ncbi:alpha-D-ribose 1-methylphosphonate 5-triphosphate diphosphatase [Pelagibius sp.]|uniref:alpha-D-ribose 1-methylphosphonate 5-triphosphate diphosphatase n=1 Tax=Pelagibius sp. TaxID=1931238 RepID=UPI00262A0599|nr:alpha-D-ribose 1-methylphosphonate 5-triphosphate diphosphatase [Pelagibius sp.]